MIRISTVCRNVRNLCFDITNNKKLPITFPKVKKEFLRSSGPGGQNVNQVSSKVQITCHIDDVCGLTYELKEYVKKKHNLTKHGEIIVQSDKFRTQNDNHEDCFQKLYDIFEKYHKELEFINRKPSKEDISILDKREKKKAQYRLEEKRRRSIKKQNRSLYFD